MTTLTPKIIFAVMAFGSLGVLARFLTSYYLSDASTTFPWGTFIINVSGSFLIGIAISYFTEARSIPAEWKVYATTGFLGGFTTFSAFSIESFALLHSGAWTKFVLYFFGSPILGVTSAFLGIIFANKIFNG